MGYELEDPWGTGSPPAPSSSGTLDTSAVDSILNSAPETSPSPVEQAVQTSGSTPQSQGVKSLKEIAAEHAAAVAQNPAVRAVDEVATALATPITHPMGFLTGLSNEAGNAGAYVASAGGLAPNPVSETLGNLGGQDYHPEATQSLADVPIVRMVPFMQTSQDIMTSEGRHHLAEHPSQVAIDVAALIPGAEGSRMASVTEKGAGLATKLEDILSHSELGRKAVAGTSGGPLEYTRTMFPTSRTSELGRLPIAERGAAQEVGRNVGGILDEVRKAKLTPEESVNLRQSLDVGRRPEEPRLGQLYDRVEAWSAANRTAKLERDIPEAVKLTLKDQTEAALLPKMSQTNLGPEKSVAMFDAFKRGADNPFPEASKAWRDMHREWHKRVLSRQREAKLFEFNPQVTRTNLGPQFDAGIAEATNFGPEVYPWKEYISLRAAKAQLERGKVTPEAYRALLDKTTPGRWQPLQQEANLAQDLARNRARYEPGFGEAAYSRIAAEGYEAWTQMAERGLNPVYVPREAMKTSIDEVRPGRAQITTAKPSSLKVASGKAEHYETDPFLMLTKDEYEMANQSTISAAIANTYRNTGGTTWDRALSELTAKGYTEAQATRIVRNRYSSFDLTGNVSRADPGNLLVYKDVGEGLKSFITHAKASPVDRLFGAWMTPVMWLSPSFQMNNIMGGGLLLGLKAGPDALLSYAKESWDAVRSGRMDPRIPLGRGMAPQYAKEFTRDSRLMEGTRLAEVWKKSGVGTLADKSRKLNEFMDSFYKSVAYLKKYDTAIKKGIDPWTAREMAGRAAQNLMQNWDAFTPFERQIVQRIFPFWGWRKAIIRTVFSYPMDHPFRMHFLYTLSRDQKERTDLPGMWDHMVGITGKDKNGKQYFISTKALDPFSDVADSLTMKGFLTNLHPFARALPDVLGVDSFRGGIPFFPRKGEVPQIDPETGLPFRGASLRPLLQMIPQLGAVARWAGVLKIPPPQDPSPQGILDWLDRYGSSFRLIPAISYKNIDEAKASLQRMIKSQQGFQKRADKLAAQTAATSATPVPVSAGAPSAGGYELQDPWSR